MVASIAKLQLGGRTADYYLERCATSKQEYYTGAGEAPGYWAGIGTKGLNLTGEVVAEHFKDLLAGRDPHSGERLKRWANTTLAIDCTFSAVKSVSALYALAPAEIREVIAEAQAEAVAAGLAYLEQRACVARLGAQGKKSQIGRGFTAAAFFQRTSREGDPQLHTHCVIANFVEALDGRRAAMDGRLLYQHAQAAGGIYDATLRAGLTRRLGLGWERRGESLEIAVVPPGLCEHWSTRRRQIEAQLRQWGQSSARGGQAAAYATRRAKDDRETDIGLNDRWRTEAHQWEGLARSGVQLNDLHTAATRAPDTLARLSDEQIIEQLVGPTGLTEKRSSFGRRDVVLEVSDRLHPTDFTPEHVQALADRVLADERVVRLLAPGRPTSGEVIRPRDEQGRVERVVFGERERRYSTAELLEVEHEVLSRVSARVGDATVVIGAEIAERAIAAYNTAHPGRELDTDQAAAVHGLCTSGNGVDAVIGVAGSGKTAMVAAYRMACDMARVPMIGVAPSATAAFQLAKGAGVEDCGTAHLLLTRIEKTGYQLPYNGVIVLDEASMIDSRTLLTLQRAADERHCKLVPIGDPHQIGSVDTGGLLPDITQRTRVFELTGNHRFDDERQKHAAELIRDGQIDRAIAEYRTLGLLHEYDHAADAWDALIDRWQQRRNTDATVAMTTDLRWAVSELNARARSRLIAAGEVARKGRTFTHPNTGESVELAVGDYVLLKDNDGGALQPDGTRVVLRNGMRATVTHITRDGVSVRLDDEHIGRDGRPDRWLTAHYTGTSVRHGWATTCDAAEGATVDHGLYLATDRASLERGYVALSRGRKTNEIYAATDSGWERELGETRAHEPAHRQGPCFDRQAVQALERDEQLSARERWLRERDAERKREIERTREIEQDRERQRGRARARAM